MATISEILKPIEDKVNQEYNTKENATLLYEIDNIISELNGGGMVSKPFDTYTMQELSVVGGKLAIYRSSLLHIQHIAMTNVKAIEASIKLLEAGSRNAVVEHLSKESEAGKKPTQADIEVATNKKMAPLKYELGLHEAYLEKIKSYWYSIPDILYRIDARIKVLEGDRKTSSFYDLDIRP